MNNKQFTADDLKTLQAEEDLWWNEYLSRESIKAKSRAEGILWAYFQQFRPSRPEVGITHNYERFEYMVRNNGCYSNLRKVCSGCLQLPKGERCSDCKSLRSLVREARKALGMCKNCGRQEPAPGFVVCSRCRTQIAENQQGWRDRVLDHYGRKCECCGTTEDLSIDHINPDLKLIDGAKGVHTRAFYRQLVHRGFPVGYQVLCRVCNASKRQGPICKLHPKKWETKEGITGETQ